MEGREPEGFFREAFQIDYYELIDLMGERPHAKEMYLTDFVGFFYYLKDKQDEDKLFRRWIVGPQFEMGFNEFKTKLKPHKVRSDEEIMEEVYAAYEKATKV